MIITTKTKTYRKISNDNIRINYKISKMCDFDEIHEYDAILIKKSVLLDQRDTENIKLYANEGYMFQRTFKNKMYLFKNIIFKESTLKEIMSDFFQTKES